MTWPLLGFGSVILAPRRGAAPDGTVWAMQIGTFECETSEIRNSTGADVGLVPHLEKVDDIVGVVARATVVIAGVTGQKPEPSK